MNKWYKAFSISIPTIMVATVIAAPIAVYCNVDAKMLDVPTKDVVIDPTTGGANFTFYMHETAQNNEVLVSVINKSHENLVTLFLDGQDPFSAENSLVYPVVDGKVNIHLSFSKFVGDNIDAIFDLEVNYLSKSGNVKSKFAHNMKLSTHYVHPESKFEQIHIYDLNDFHGAAEGYGDDDPDQIFSNVSYHNPGVLRIGDQLYPKLQQYPGSIFVTAGDNNSGDTFSTSTHGATLYPVLKAMGARYSAVGNHAFEWGLDDTASERFDKWARTDETYGKYFVCSNIINHPWYQDKTWTYNPDWSNPTQVEKYNEDYITWKNQRVEWADPYKLINMNGHLVCLLGLTTQSAMEDGNQAVVRAFSFADYAASLYYSTNYLYETVGEDWFNSIETFVVLTHVESVSAEERLDGADSKAWDLAGDIVLYNPERTHTLTENDPTKKVSAIISGHSHKSVEDFNTNIWTGQPISIGQAATAGRQYLDTTLWFDNSQPIGKRWIVPDATTSGIITKPYDVKIDTGIYDPTDPEEKQQAWEVANREIKRLHNSPPNDYVKHISDVYYENVAICKEKLNDIVGHSNTGEKYLPHHFTQLGHAYWPDPQTAQTLPFGDYIQPMGAWSNMAQIAGFDAQFWDEIKSPDNSITAPSISFINLDSLTTEFPNNSDIKLSNIYDLQGYENSTYFGYLSIWQLANIIDYMLSGFNQFEYGSKNNHSYVKVPEDAGADHCLQYNDQSNMHIQCSGNFETIEDCLYLCGPYQWYGFRFTYDVINDPAEQARLDRKVKLHYIKYGTDADPVYYPDIYIYVPGEHPQEHIREPNRWMPAKEYEEQIGLIPCVINDFLYSGGNGQSTMFAPYFRFNENQGKEYAIHHFSTITRDLMIKFCDITRAIPPIIPFDLEYSISSQLMTEFK